MMSERMKEKIVSIAVAPTPDVADLLRLEIIHVVRMVPCSTYNVEAALVCASQILWSVNRPWIVLNISHRIVWVSVAITCIRSVML